MKILVKNRFVLPALIGGLGLILLPAVVEAQFIFTTNNGAITITGYTGSGGAVAVPSTTNGLPVVIIGSCAFSNQTSVTSITLPNGVTNIGSDAFVYCYSLTNASIGTNVTTIGDEAFYYCNNLTSATIPNSVTSIGDEAFYNCALADVTISSNTTNIGDYAFAFCTSLESITVNSNNPAYCSLAGALFNKSLTTLIQYPAGQGGDYTIPNSVTAIGEYAFDGCTLSSVTMGTNITNIPDGAFYYCNNLTSVTIPNGVTSIGDYAFTACVSLSVTIPDTVTSIGDDAFYSCFFSSITIPNSVTNIGDYAFGFNSYLAGVYFLGNAPSGDSTMFSDYPYEGSDNPTVYYVPGTTGWGPTFCGAQTGLWDPQIQCAYMITNGTIINGGITNSTITIIGHNGSGGAVIIPSMINYLPVTSIGNSAFYAFSSLTSITIPNSVTSIGDHAFANCYSLTNVTIPSSVTSIGDYAFNFCYSLTSVTIPNSLTNIGDYTFEYCGSLTSVTIPNSVTSIGTNGFGDCYSLTSITIPNSVTSIGDSAFANCGSLTSVTIPNSVTSIGGDAFAGCYSLTNIYFQGNTPNADSTVFSGDNATVYYLPGTSGWGTMFGGVPAEEWTGPAVTTASLPNGTKGTAYSQQLTASGGKTPYSWTVTPGGLPSGLTLGTGGLIFGTPTTNGTFNFTVKVTDATNSTATQTLSLTINSSVLQVTTTWLVGGTTTVAYSQQLTASGGQPPYRWTNIVGTLPPGLSLTTSGVISGTPTFAGTANFTVQVIDAITSTAAQAVALNISVFSPLQITTASLTNGTSGVAYNQQLTASGGQPPYYSWSLVSGSLPPGLAMATNGLISGTPTLGGTANFTVEVTDALAVTATEPMTLTVMAKVLHTFSGSPTDGANPGTVILSGNTLYGTASGGGSNGNGAVFAVNTDGTGFTNLYNFTASSYHYNPYPGGGYYFNGDGANPSGLILSGNTLYGTASVCGSSGYGTLFAVNSDGTDFTNLHNFNGTDGYSPNSLILCSNTLYGTAMSTVFAIKTDGTGFTNLYNFTGGSDGGQPGAGLILFDNTIYGTTVQGGAFGNGTVFAVNTDGTGFTNLYSFTGGSDGAMPRSGLTLSGNTLYGTTSSGAGTVAGTVFSINTDGTGFTTLYDFGVIFVGYTSDGQTPYAGLTLSGNTLYGTTTAGGNSINNGGSGTVFGINPDGTGYTSLYSFTEYNYDNNESWTNSDGAYPVGNLVLSGNSLYGTAQYGGSSGNGTVFSLLLPTKPLQVATVLLPNGTNGDTYSNQLTAFNGQLPYSWSLISGALPSGLTLAPSGVISGTPTANGTFDFTVKVTDATNSTATQALALTVLSPIILSTPQISAGSTNFTFQLTGPSGSNYVLQVSTNLLNWSPVSTSSIPVSGSITLSNAISGYNRRFYRVYLQ